MTGVRPPVTQQDGQIGGVYYAVAIQVGHARIEAFS